MDNRSTILATALQLFTARGYDAVGVQEIVDSAGITKPTLYHYFGSKRGLLETLLERDFTSLVNSVQLAAGYHGDLPLTLEQVARTFFVFAKTHPTFYRLQLALWFTPQESEAHLAVAPWNERLNQTIEQMFFRAAEQHGNMRHRQRAYAATYLGMINTYIGVALNGYTELDEALIYQAVHQFMYGIFS
jgi:AcrR family transcriptional regulator